MCFLTRTLSTVDHVARNLTVKHVQVFIPEAAKHIIQKARMLAEAHGVWSAIEAYPRCKVNEEDVNTVFDYYTTDEVDCSRQAPKRCCERSDLGREAMGSEALNDSVSAGSLQSVKTCPPYGCSWLDKVNLAASTGGQVLTTSGVMCLHLLC